MTELLEREDKWDVDDQFQLPRLDDVVHCSEVSRSSVELTSTYFDTADHDLESHGVYLRRRDGDDDTGWQLKVPASGNGRTEIRAALTDTPPADLLDMLTGIRLGKPLTQVATIHTTRDRYRITSTDGRVVEVDDDHVRASAGDEKLLAWREIEVELGTGVDAAPKKLTRRLTKAGARPSQYRSKLLRLNRNRINSTPQPTNPAVGAFADYVTDQIDDIFAGDLGLRRGQDPIHDTRVAIRRLRSTLRVFKKILDPATVRGVDDELKWFAGLLGEVRDCQVQRRRFLQTLATWPPELVLGPVSARITTELRGVELPARQAVTEAMNSDRYLTLLSTLAQWRTHPPIAGEPTTKDLNKRARRAYAKADDRLAEALRSSDDALLHRARKASKRARYAAELQQSVMPRAKKTAKAFKQVQRVLGDYQDGVVAVETLRRLGTQAGTTDGENGFTFGLLYAHEKRRMDDARDAAHTLLSANS